MDDLRVSLPLKDLIELVTALDGMDKREKDLLALRRELEGVRNIVYECMTAIGDLRKEIRQALR